MGKGFGKYALVYILCALFVLFLDLISKELAQAYLQNRDITLLPFLHLVLVYNKGVAFGFFSDAPSFVRIPILLLTPIIALVITFIYALRSKNFFNVVLMGMVGGGALGNFYDRLFLGYVRDFIYLSYGGLSWPAFNIADASISIALFIFILRGMKTGKA
ncbi:MAG: signal peptidase II [Aquificaceae bacterium]